MVIAARQEMSKRSSGLHRNHLRVKRTEAHGASEMFNRYLRLATMNSHPPTGVPGSRQIWIEDERAIHKGRSVIQVSDHVRERVGTPR